MNQFQLNIHNQILLQIQMIESMNMGWQKKGSCYVSLSFEYFNMGYDEMGVDLLLKIPQIYFDKYMQEELTNPDFLEVTLLLIDFMMKSEFIQKDDKLQSLFFKLRGSGNA